LNNFWCFPIEA